MCEMRLTKVGGCSNDDEGPLLRCYYDRRLGESRSSLERFKSIIPECPAHGGVLFCTVQCRPASVCAIKSPPGVFEGTSPVKSNQKSNNITST